MVDDQFDTKGVFSFKAENDSPVGPHRYGLESAQIAFEGVQAIAGQVRSLRRRGGIENRQDSFYCVEEVGAYSASVAAFIEAFEASMLEAPNHSFRVK